MESNCCGASEWMEDTGICGACKEHSEFTDEDEDEDINTKQEMMDKKWVLFRKDKVVKLGLSLFEARQLMNEKNNIHQTIDFSIKYDQYYEYHNIKPS
jgi:hypothetical protein